MCMSRILDISPRSIIIFLDKGAHTCQLRQRSVVVGEALLARFASLRAEQVRIDVYDAFYCLHISIYLLLCRHIHCQVWPLTCAI